MAREKVLLVTGFGRFPGAPFNPTERIVAALGGGFARRLARLGWRLERRILPVRWDALATALARLEAELRPDAILHLGLAARRKNVTVEARAHNRRRPLSFDAAGRRAETWWIEKDAPPTRATTANAARLVAAMRRATPTAVSHDAGAYLCNLALWESVTRRPDRPVAFVHVPRPGAAGRPRLGALVRASEAACLALAAARRRV